MTREQFIERYAPKIATYIFCRSAINTTTSNWHTSFEEINSRFNVDLYKDKELVEAIEDVLYSDFEKMVLELEVNNNEFDIIIGTSYCIEDTDYEDALWEE